MKQTRAKATARNFFESKAVKQALSDPKRRANIGAKALLFQLAAELEQIRVKSGVTQKELAERIKISQQELSRIERGKRNITLETLFRISEGFDLMPLITFQKLKDYEANKH